MIAKLSRKDIKMLESSVKNDVSESALEEYLSAHKKAETAWKVFRDSLVLSEGSSEDNASKESKGEKVRKFKAGDKVRVLDTRFPVAASLLRVGDITKVVDYKRDQDMGVWFNLQQRPVVVEDNYSNERGFFEESALELVVEEEKSPNELRAEVIQRAKEFVKDIETTKLSPMTNTYRYNVKVAFIVNADKRAVVALLKSISSNKVVDKGVAKCHSEDVFNEYIGKAIALGRVLGKDVSEFENAVQPTIAVGQTVEFESFLKKEVVKVKSVRWSGEPYISDWLYTSKYKIIDDTKVQYGVNNE